MRALGGVGGGRRGREGDLCAPCGRDGKAEGCLFFLPVEGVDGGVVLFDVGHCAKPAGSCRVVRRLMGLLGGKKEREKPGRERLGAGEGLLGPGRACGGGIYESAVRGRRPGDANPVNLHLHQVQLFPATIRTRLACLSESFSVACQEHQSSASALDDCHEGCGCPCCPLLQAWSSR